MNVHVRNPGHGFTLIEVMIAVAIVAILAAVAYPSYLDSVRKSKRAEGRTALLELLQQQERYITQINRYYCFSTDASNGSTSVITADGNGICPATGTAGTIPFKSFSGGALAGSAYVLSAENCSATTSIQDCVRLVATPRGSHDKDYDVAGQLRITTTGAKDCRKRDGTIHNTAGICWS